MTEEHVLRSETMREWVHVRAPLVEVVRDKGREMWTVVCDSHWRRITVD